MTAFVSPVSHGATEPVIGRTFHLLGPYVFQALVEQFDIRQFGLLNPLGDVAGTATDTLRKAVISNVGWGAAFATAGSETEAIDPSGWSAETYDATVGRHVLGFEETFQRRLLQGDGITLEFIGSGIASAAIARLRKLSALAAASFATNAADAADEFTVDDVLNLVGLAAATTGFQGTLNALVHSVQYHHLVLSTRSEASLQMPDQFNSLQALRPQNGFMRNFLGVNFFTSSDVTLAGGDYYGGAWVPGALGSVIASTAPLANAGGSVVVPELGLVITPEFNGRQALHALWANMWAGVGTAPVSQAPQWLLRSNATVV